MRPAYLGREEKFTRCTRRVPRSLARSLARLPFVALQPKWDDKETQEPLSRLL